MSETAVNLARANLYRYLSVAVLPPDAARFALLADDRFREAVSAAVCWIAEDESFHPPRVGPAELAPSALDPADLFPEGDDLASSYAAVFGHAISKDCPPYENEYCPSRDITYLSHRMADISGFYRAFGLDRSPADRERPDHLSYLAEFMQIVIARQLYAEEQGLNDECVVVCREVQRRFFDEHLGWWLPAFGLQLEQRAAPAFGFYVAVARFVRGLAAAERAVLDLAPSNDVPDVQVDSFESEEGCFECGLGGEEGSPADVDSVFSPAGCS